MLTVPVPPRERGLASSLDRPVVLAVSGGADSMVLADDLFTHQRDRLLGIATYDHGTGAAASDAVALVQRWAAEREIVVHAARAGALRRTEAAWRAARWGFLHAVSAEVQAPIATAHTEDDQAETVFMRLLRGSGVRGLAGLLAPSPVRRPLLGVTRGTVRDRALAGKIPFLEDPSNADLRFLRNRARLELLPALERSQPGFRAWLLDVGQRSAAWRAEVAAAVDRHWEPWVAADGERITVPRDRRRLPSHDEAALFWPEVAGRVALALDHRGTARLASFTTHQATGQAMPLSGGWCVTSSRHEWSLQRAGAIHPSIPPSDRLAPRGG